MPELHSKTVGGSTAARIIACPGSYTLSQDAPPQPVSEYAAEGTFLHEVMHRILSGEMEATDINVFSQDGFVYDRDMYTEMIWPALAALDQMTVDYGAFEYESEARVHFEKIPGSFGTADLVALTPKASLVVDWKFGRGVPVDAHKNAQLMYYACAARSTSTTEDLMRRNRVVLGIVQPAMSPEVSIYETTHEELDQFEVDLVAAWEAASLPDATLRAGQHCRFCPAKSICPEIRKGVDLGLEMADKGVKVSELHSALPLADRLEEWIKEVRRVAHATLEQGGDVPGYKLVPKRAQRKWIDEDYAGPYLARQLRMTRDSISEKKLLSPAKIERIARANGKDWSKMQAKLVTSVSSGTTLAPISDPRPAVSPSGSGVDLNIEDKRKEETGNE